MPPRTQWKVWGLCLNGRDRLIVAAKRRSDAEDEFLRVGVRKYQFRMHAERSRDASEIAAASRVPEVVLARGVAAPYDAAWRQLR